MMVDELVSHQERVVPIGRSLKVAKQMPGCGRPGLVPFSENHPETMLGPMSLDWSSTTIELPLYPYKNKNVVGPTEGEELGSSEGANDGAALGDALLGLTLIEITATADWFFVSKSPIVPSVLLFGEARPVPTPFASSTDQRVTFTVATLVVDVTKPGAGRNVTDPLEKMLFNSDSRVAGSAPVATKEYMPVVGLAKNVTPLTFTP
jgi:hypothetical protein